MIYEYRCTLCDKIIDVEHPMSEVGNLSEETKAKLKCLGVGQCEFIKEGEEDVANKIEFVRHYGSMTYLKFDALPVAEKQKMLKKRASEDFKKNIEEKKRALQGKAVNEMRNIVKGE